MKIYIQEPCLKIANAKSRFSRNFQSGDRTFFHVTAAVLNCQGQIQPNCKQLTIGSSQCVVKSVCVIQYSKKSGAHDNFTCNEYNTLTNNNNMKI